MFEYGGKYEHNKIKKKKSPEQGIDPRSSDSDIKMLPP